MGDFFLQIILFFYHNLAFQNLGLTIIEIAVVTRLIFYPLTKQQTHLSKKTAELQPLLKQLKTKHKDNQQALYQAQMELYKQHGINPASGCLPLIVQMAILIGLFGAMNTILTMNLNTTFFIWNMAKPDAYKIGGVPFMIPGILVVIAALTQYFQTKMMLPKPPAIKKDDKPKEKEEKVGFTESYAEAQASMVWMFPLLFLFFGTQWPSGLALYWSVSSILALIQQMNIVRKISNVQQLKSH